jgi:hypothetical protein
MYKLQLIQDPNRVLTSEGWKKVVSNRFSGTTPDFIKTQCFPIQNSRIYATQHFSEEEAFQAKLLMKKEGIETTVVKIFREQQP